jgi:hypothetical protein
LDGAQGDEGGYADGVLRSLGARVLETLDYSDYEGASITHDMNKPIPDSLEERFSAVIDGGSLEHIFNFPQALLNCMRLASIGGHVITAGPANNFFGHGLYQFSAELWFRAFSPQNGFDELEVLLVEDTDAPGGWFKVLDPAVARQRVTFSSATPTLMFVCARKVRAISGWGEMPYQSDYIARWAQGSGPTQSRASAASAMIQLTAPLRQRVKTALFGGPRAHRQLFTPLQWDSP